MQILCKEGVIGRDAGNLQPPCVAHACIVGEKWRVNMDDVKEAAEIMQRGAELPPAHAAILRIARHAGGGYPHDSWARRGAREPVVGRDQHGLDVAGCKVLPERPHGCRHAIDAREINVGYKKYAH